MGKKKVRAVLKLELQAGRATPAPPVGTALGPHGINIMEFTKAYNERTAQQAGDVVPALITIFEDRSFSFVLKTPPAVQLLKRAAGVEKRRWGPGPGESRPDGPRDVDLEVRCDGRGAHPARRRPAARGADGARIGRAAERHRKEGARRCLRRRR